jgi:hypothetical protein
VGTVRFRYQRGDTGAEEIQAAVDETLTALRDPASDEARAAGVDPAVLADARIEVREGAHGADPILTPILIGISIGAGTKVAGTVWEDLVWPALRKRLGVRVLGPRKAEAAGSEYAESPAE